MANEPTEVVVAGDGRIFVADPADVPTLPTSETDTAVESAPWYELGYVPIEGVGYQDDFTQEVLRAWQAVAAIRVLTTERNPKITFALMQWNPTNMVLAFGGGEVVSSGVYEGPRASDPPVERSLVLDAIDGDTIYRFVYPRVGLSQGSSFQLTRSTSANLSLVMAVLDPGGDDPLFKTYSNAASMEPIGS
jgi:hypothetical protein